jgi:hypothetical protein
MEDKENECMAVIGRFEGLCYQCFYSGRFKFETSKKKEPPPPETNNIKNWENKEQNTRIPRDKAQFSLRHDNMAVLQRSGTNKVHSSQNTKLTRY